MKTHRERVYAVKDWLAKQPNRRDAARYILALEQAEIAIDSSPKALVELFLSGFPAIEDYTLYELAEELADLYGAEDEFEFKRLQTDVNEHIESDEDEEANS